ncbi:hypothetical protein JKP88DRAFT_289433 [Tribonema minus]|uniref:C2H2-type domain-containing protein n=1 Tax=Tribonema minus TaxID=303371 RepID=A0A835Z851_9STRA|nr:hypothetical protein JKP88DRAFT_289433 [Tribonema minus]
MLLQEVALRLHCLTAETGCSSWGRGTQSRDALWGKAGGTLAFRVTEAALRDAKAYNPKLKVQLIAVDASAPALTDGDFVGWFALDLRDLASGRMEQQWVKLQGCLPAEVQVSGCLRVVPEELQQAQEQQQQQQTQQEQAQHEQSQAPSQTSSVIREPSPPAAVATAAAASTSAAAPCSPAGGGSHAAASAAAAEAAADALPVGDDAASPDARMFTLSLTIMRASNLAQSAPDLAGTGARVWLSYSLFDIVVQTEQFSIGSGDGTSGGSGGGTEAMTPACDAFRLRATLGGLARHLHALSPLRVYVCTHGRVIGAVHLPLAQLLPLDVPSGGSGGGGRGAARFSRAAFEAALPLHSASRSSAPAAAAAGTAPHPTVTIAAELVCGDATQSPPPPLPQHQQQTTGTDSAPQSPPEAPLPQPPPAVPLPGGVTARLGALTLGAALRARGGGGGALRVAIGDSAAPAEQFDLVRWEWARGVAAAAAAAAQDDEVAVGPMTRVCVTCAVTGEEVAAGDVPWPRGAGAEEAARVALRAPDGAPEPIWVESEPDRTRRLLAARAWVCIARGVSCTVLMRAWPPGETPADVAGLEDAAAAGGGDGGDAHAPRHLRLSIHLAAVRDMAEAAFVLARYRYPRLLGGAAGTVRSGVAWVPPRCEAALANAACSFEFGAALPALRACAQDAPLMVSLIAREAFAEREPLPLPPPAELALRTSGRCRCADLYLNIGLAALPLEELTRTPPAYFRCPNTGRTFTSRAAYRAHQRARRGGGGGDAAAAAPPPRPVEIRVLDKYLTVVSGDAAAFAEDAAAAAAADGAAAAVGAKRHQPERVCSLRAVLMLEDVGPTGEPGEAPLGHRVPARAVTVSPARGARGGAPSHKAPAGAWEGGVESDAQQRDSAQYGGAAGAGGGGEGGVGGEQARAPAWEQDWEAWRAREEAAFARKLAAKDAALEQRWAQREAERRRSLAQAQAEYARLEGKLRRALTDVEVRGALAAASCGAAAAAAAAAAASGAEPIPGFRSSDPARERALRAREEELRSEAAQKASEMQMAQRRLREESKHQADLHKLRVAELERRAAAQEAALAAAEARAKAAEDDSRQTQLCGGLHVCEIVRVRIVAALTREPAQSIVRACAAGQARAKAAEDD